MLSPHLSNYCFHSQTMEVIWGSLFIYWIKTTPKKYLLVNPRKQQEIPDSSKTLPSFLCQPARVWTIKQTLGGNWDKDRRVWWFWEGVVELQGAFSSLSHQNSFVLPVWTLRKSEIDLIDLANLSYLSEFKLVYTSLISTSPLHSSEKGHSLPSKNSCVYMRVAGAWCPSRI